MPDAVGTIAGTTATTDVTRTDKAGQMGDDVFMRLLLEQMKHQDPSSPMDSSQMMAQMAQFSTVEALTKLNKQFDALQGAQNFEAAVGLIGRSVTYTGSDGQRHTGQVSGVDATSDGARLRIGSDRVATGQIDGVA